MDRFAQGAGLLFKAREALLECVEARGIRLASVRVLLPS
jgi:hypothetical protein